MAEYMIFAESGNYDVESESRSCAAEEAPLVRGESYLIFNRGDIPEELSYEQLQRISDEAAGIFGYSNNKKISQLANAFYRVFKESL